MSLSSIHSYGRSNKIILEDEEKVKELERLREEYLKKKREEEEKEKERLAVEAIVIGVVEVEMYPLGNGLEHHTHFFELAHCSDPPIILRRGQPFDICIRFQRRYDQQDSTFLEFSIGSKHRTDKGTLIRLPIIQNALFTQPVEEWDVRLIEEEPQVMHLQIQISCKAAVGTWKLNVISSHPNSPSLREHKVQKLIYILFNPWCKEDAVSMENEILREEYVLNEIGKLYGGSSTNPRPRIWIYGQFSKVVLPAAMAILERSALDDTARGSPVKVVRALSAMLNSQDDNGVIQGRWGTSYEGGIAPYEWTGSRDILERYLRNGFKPVKYGQCWVFAGLFTSISRALGIPCRPVTNYVSAHDSDDTLTIDRYFTEDGRKLRDDDSIWNFHVWNDCWMTRPDLPAGYDGWQAVDSTPQETSEGIYQTGPASLYAVKRGEVGFLYDSPFVFSEVNADVIYWERDLTARIGWRKLWTDNYHVGRLIVTKKPGATIDCECHTDIEDITDQYKEKEGSLEERLVIRNAATHGHYAMKFSIPTPDTGDVFFDMEEIDKVMIGQPFSVILHVENRSSENRVVNTALTADTVFYTGVKASTIMYVKYNLHLRPKQKEVVVMKVTCEEYYQKLVGYSMIKIFAVGVVEETKQSWSEEDDFYMEKPCLKLQVTKPLRVGQPFELSITLVNPLRLLLQNCFFVVEGPGLAEPQRSYFRDILPEEKITHKLSFVPKRAGKEIIFVIFNSKELIDVQGLIDVEVF